MEPHAGQTPPPSRLQHHRQGSLSNTLWLALGATGVVFGDTGTSPLYTYSGIFANELHAKPEADDVKGAFSMIFWVLTWTVCIKYLTVVMRVDHHGEGGILALMQVTLDQQRVPAAESQRQLLQSEPVQSIQNQEPEEPVSCESCECCEECCDRDCRDEILTLLGTLGCAALFGDSVITPSISVLSAVDLLGAEVAQGWKVALAVVILVCLFSMQKNGSKRIGEAAGPVMVCWFLTIAALGIRDLLKFSDQALVVVGALHPAALLDFWTKGRFTGVLAWKAMAGVVLSITGAEALYSDMGHFGLRPISLAWFLLVYPSLVLQYMGQAAAIMYDPSIVNNPFGSTVPGRAKMMLVFLAILATIQASQALISGTFTLFTQAHALGFIPHIRVVHTNVEVRGQVYLPEVNWALMTACIIMCLLAQNSQYLAGAYGITVTSTFMITTLLLSSVLWRRWGFLPMGLLIVPMLGIDVMFWSSNLVKLLPLGWIPVVIGGAAFTAMRAQQWGNQRKKDIFAAEAAEPGRGQARRSLDQAHTVDGLLAVLTRSDLPRTLEAGVYLTPAPGRVPQSLAALAMSKNSLPRLILLLHVHFDDAPFVPEDSRCEFEAVDPELGLYHATLHFGWAEVPGAVKASTEDDDEVWGSPATCSPGLHAAVRQLARSHVGEHEDLGQLDAEASPGNGVIYIVNNSRYDNRDKDDCSVFYFACIYDGLRKLACSPVDLFGLSGCEVVEVEISRFL